MPLRPIGIGVVTVRPAVGLSAVRPVVVTLLRPELSIAPGLHTITRNSAGLSNSPSAAREVRTAAYSRRKQ